MRVVSQAKTEKQDDRHDRQCADQCTLRVHGATPGSAARIDAAGMGVGDPGARTGTTLSRSAHARRHRAVGQMEMSAPQHTINPPNQIHGTSGSMITLSVAVDPSLANDMSVM